MEVVATIELVGGVGIIRTSEGLYRHVWRVEVPVDEVPATETALTAVLHRAMLRRVGFTPVNAAERRLSAAWDALGSVRPLNADVLTALLIVLTSTVSAASDAMSGPLPFTGLDKPRRVRPTAAHPRAFQGTTYKPPKEKTQAPIDLRPYLGNRGAISEILDRLRRYWSEGVGELNRFGVDIHALVDPDCDPYAAVNYGVRRPMTLPDLDPGFRLALLPSLRGRAWAEVERVHRLYHRLRLDDDPTLIALFAAMLEGRDATAIARWGEILLTIPADLRAGLAMLLMRTGAVSADPSLIAVDIGEVLQQLKSGADSAYRIYCLLRCVAAAGDIDYLLAGFRLSDRLYPLRSTRFAHSFHEATVSGSYPEVEVERLVSRLEGTTEFEAWTIAAIWTACGSLEGFGAFVVERNLTQWPDEVVWTLLHTFLIPHYAETDPDAAKWRYLRCSGSLIDAALADVPTEYRHKFCRSFFQFVNIAEPSTLTPNSIPNACALLRRLCDQPFHPERNTAHVWVDFLSNLPAHFVEKFLSAPNVAFEQLEKACRTKNGTNNIGYGTWAMAKVTPDFALAAFLQAPARLFRTAKTLGCLDQAERIDIMREVTQTPMMRIDTDLLDDAHAYAYIDEHSRGLRVPCISAALCAHYDGSRQLNAPRLEHYQADMRLQWMRARLQGLEDAVLERLARPYPMVDVDGNVVHALRLERNVEENRRALRKFLTAYWSGREDYILTHPLTRAWLAKHPGLNVDLWLNGISFSGATERDGELTIQQENEPLEALKLGTYVGSCLGLGGGLQYSAAANVLDINKQVLYARNADGNVVGRQLVAYSEAEELVCFEVYPIGTPDDLRSLFAMYDERFADALGVPIHQTPAGHNYGDEEYDIACILSSGWWDDHHWDR